MGNDTRNERDFGRLARRRRRRVRLTKRDIDMRKTDRSELAEEVDDRTLSVISRHL